MSTFPDEVCHMNPTTPLLLRSTVGTLFLVLSGTACLAQTADDARMEKARAQLQKRFTAADTNADGRLSRDEAKAGMPRVYKQFDSIDSDKAGSITIDQIASFVAQRRQR
jgi:hypothetical protein